MMPIVREGRIAFLGVFVLALVLTVTEGAILATPLWVVTLILGFMLRELPRSAPASPLAVLSPVDGKVLSVKACHDPYRERKSQCIRLLQRRMGPYGLYAPIEGKVLKVWQDEEKGGSKQVVLWVQTDEGDDIVLAICRSRLFGYLRFRVQAGERVGHGSRWGFAAFGRVMDLYLPEDSRVEVTPDTHLRADQVVGKLRRL